MPVPRRLCSSNRPQHYAIPTPRFRHTGSTITSSQLQHDVIPDLIRYRCGAAERGCSVLEMLNQVQHDGVGGNSGIAHTSPNITPYLPHHNVIPAPTLRHTAPTITSYRTWSGIAAARQSVGAVFWRCWIKFSMTGVGEFRE